MRALTVLAIMCAAAAPALAGHYELFDVPFLQDEERTKLEAQGITTTELLLHRIVKKSERRELAKKTGLSAARLDELADKVDLLRVMGIGPKMVAMLQASGVKNVAALRAEQPEPLHKRVAEANDRLHVSEIIPMAEVLGGWIDQARGMPILLEE